MPQTEFTDAIALLKNDHRTVEDLFEKFESAGSNSKRALAEQICNELKIHAIIEEEIFYPALKDKIEDDTLNEAYVEHDGAKLLINDILSSSDDEMLDAKIKVLSEEIKHHVHEEEMPSEGMFAQAREAGVDLAALRDQLIARKQSLLETLKTQGLPPAEMQVLQA